MADMKVKNRLVVEASEAIVNGQQVTTTANTQTLTNKSIDGSTNTLTNIPNSALSSGIDAVKIADGSVSNTEFQYLDGVTSAIQTQLNAKAADNIVIKKDGSVTYTADQSMGGFKLTNVADPVASQDAVTLAYMNARLNGLTPKAPVRAATTGNITLSGAQTIDTVSVIAGNRVLVKNQTLPEQNGIYVAAAGAWARSADMDAVTPFDEFNGAWTTIQEGTQTGQVFVQYGTVSVVGTDAVNFAYYNPIAGLIGGDMITFAGSTFSVDLATASGLESTNPGNVAGQLQVKLNGGTLDRSTSGLKVADNSITNTQINSAAGIVYSKLSLTNSIVNADIASAAAIALSKLAAITASRALVSDGSGIISASAVTSTELGYVSGVTSAIQTQLNGKANTALTNLASTAVNVNLNPGVDNSISLGTSLLRYSQVNSVNAAHDQIVFPNIAVIDSTTARTAPSGLGSSDLTIYAPNLAKDIGIYGGDPTSANGRNIFVETANRTGALNAGALSLYTGTTVNGNGGNITITTGAPSGSGTRGNLQINTGITQIRSQGEVRFMNSANTFYTSLKAGANSANASFILPLADGSANQVLKTDGSGNLSFASVAQAVTGDITPTTFSFANNQAAAANVTGLAFANAVTRSFKALVDVQLDATTDAWEVYELLGVQKGASWDMSQVATGDTSGVVFSITNAGQVQYTSANAAGFVSGTMKFRATTIPVV